MGMKIIDTPIAGVKIVQSTSNADNRGSFTRWYCEKELAPILDSRRIVQINHSKTVKSGSIRGMHMQKPPHAEMKLIRCLRGRVWDVALDLRAGSPTFLKWYATELSEGSNMMIVIPEGCAHGFQAMEDDSELLYLHTAFYEPSSEFGINYADPLISISWQLDPTDISGRDKNYKLLDAAFRGF